MKQKRYQYVKRMMTHYLNAEIKNKEKSTNAFYQKSEENRTIIINDNFEKLKSDDIREDTTAIKNLVSLLGFNNINDTKKIEQKYILVNMEKCKKEAIIFTNKMILDSLVKKYNIKNKDIQKLNTNKKFIGFVNSVISKYGIKFKCSVSKCLNKNVYYYMLEHQCISKKNIIIHFLMIKLL
jgi:hypothetical protein